VATIRPFRALRYDERAGSLDDLVAPPYDVIGPDERRAYLERSPYNAVHLTLPESPAEAAAVDRVLRRVEAALRARTASGWE